MLVEIIASGTLLVLMIIYYYYEFMKLSNIKKSIKIRIAVTGSRGKSTTVRFLCDLFQKAGYRVLGKVTGTKPMLILPDGKTELIKRKGIVSILEQKRILLNRAKKIRPDILISEIMSVTPEYQKIETKLMITPDYYIITNIKEDHIGITGEDKNDICKVFLESAPKNSTILALEDEKKAFESTNLYTENIIFLEASKVEQYLQPGFEQTILFAKQMCRELGISDQILSQAISEYQFDEEVFFIKNLNKNTVIVNAFSANDVDSTWEIFQRIVKDYPEYKYIALFCTRTDKPERTQSWIQSFKTMKWEFDALLVLGPHFKSIKRGKYLFPLKKMTEEELLKLIYNDEKTLLFGFGNYVNSGERVVEFWNKQESSK